MTLREELQSKKDALYALKERIEADDAEAITEGEQLKADIEAKTAELRQAEKKAALLGVIGAKEKEDTSMSDVKARSLGENFVNFVKTSDHGKRFDLSAPAFVKAATDVQTSPAAAVDFATTFDRNVVTAPRTPLVIRDLFGAETISGSTLVYLVGKKSK